MACFYNTPEGPRSFYELLGQSLVQLSEAKKLNIHISQLQYMCIVSGGGGENSETDMQSHASIPTIFS